MKCIQPEDIADSALYILSAPPHVQVRENTSQLLFQNTDLAHKHFKLQVHDILMRPTQQLY
jgi:hypothetical protein